MANTITLNVYIEGQRARVELIESGNGRRMLLAVPTLPTAQPPPPHGVRAQPRTPTTSRYVHTAHYTPAFRTSPPMRYTPAARTTPAMRYIPATPPTTPAAPASQPNNPQPTSSAAPPTQTPSPTDLSIPDDNIVDAYITEYEFNGEVNQEEAADLSDTDTDTIIFEQNGQRFSEGEEYQSLLDGIIEIQEEEEQQQQPTTTTTTTTRKLTTRKRKRRSSNISMRKKTNKK